MSEEQFTEWVNRRSRLPLAVAGHSLSMRGDNVILIDRGQFVYEEALHLVRMLNSRNPVAQMSANVTIWERNGTLKFIALALIALILIVVLLFARH
ncbi:MAG: hypothetical protein OK441_01245 [Thaumarchaeota archaeon]|nr:hypothetical protein [Nitrososphaerota archaeon]